jgi:uncharacterized protein (DUF3820 family)
MICRFNGKQNLPQKTVLNFGKYKGKTLLQILDENPSYIVWLADNNIINIPNDLLTTALSDIMPPDFEDLHNDWGCRDDC